MATKTFLRGRGATIERRDKTMSGRAGSDKLYGGCVSAVVFDRYRAEPAPSSAPACGGRYQPVSCLAGNAPVKGPAPQNPSTRVAAPQPNGLLLLTAGASAADAKSATSQAAAVKPKAKAVNTAAAGDDDALPISKDDLFGTGKPK